jgi:parallel beta-helix repeat protein
MKKLLTISLVIILTLAFCFNCVPKSQASTQDKIAEIKSKISQIQREVPISGDAVHISSDTIWDTDQLLDDHYIVDPGSTLTIMPGVIVRFNGLFSLVVAGNLVANGSSSQPITFTHNTPPDNYFGISCQSGSNVFMSYCNINYAGAEIGPDTYTAGISIGGSFSAQNCTFANSALLNVLIYDDSGASFSYNTFDNSSDLGIISVDSSTPNISNNVFQNTLIGILSMEDTQGVITDNNFTSSMLGIVTEDNATTFINDNTFDNNIIGIYLSENSNTTIRENVINNNIDSGIYIDDSIAIPAATICYNNISGNIDFGIQIGTGGGLIIGNGVGDLPINAVKNYWGAASGPTHPSNPGGTGDAVSDNVTFTPWLDASFTTLPTIGTVNLIDGQTVSGTYTITADANWVVHGLPQEDITKVDFYIDGELKGSDTTYPYTYDWDTTQHASLHTVRIVTTNVLGNTGEKSYNVNTAHELPYTGQ